MPLRLRMLCLENTSELFSLINQNKQHLRRWFEWAHEIQTEADTQAFIEESLQKNKLNRAFDSGIWLNNQLIGIVGLHEINWRHKEVEIGYWIGEKHQGQGLTKQAILTMMAYAFFEYKLNRIKILCVTENTRSRCLAEKLGFQFEGIEREGYQFLGRFFDVACYSFLARDFQVVGEETYVQLARQICPP